MVSKRHWSDQPKFLENGNVLFRAFINGRIAEVRDVPEKGLHVTTGNLFGSQTLKCDDYPTVLKVLQLVNDTKDGEHASSVPVGAEIIE